MCTHRTYGALAERLAARGFTCIRFDYDGTGDSAGRFGDPGRVRAWQEGIDAAIDALRGTTGVKHIGLFGVRFGATLAAVVARGRQDVQSLVAWAPAVSGRAYVREMRAFRMIQAAKMPATPSTGGVEAVAGYPFGAETLASMSAFDLTSDPRPVAGRVLLLARDDLPGNEEGLATHLRAGGATVQLEREPGYAAMMRDPQESILPVKALETIVGWLEATAGASEVPAAPAGTPSSTIRSPSFDEALAFFPSGREADLFGVVTAPTASVSGRNRPAILFLNVGANHHVGPNRMYVLLARDLAARGYTSMRFDVAGLGDSPAPPGSGEVRLYSKDSVADVKAAMTFLDETRHARRFVLVGLCSGAYLSFHTAIEDPRVVGQILLNPQTFEWKEGDSLELSVRRSFLSSRHYARALLDPSVWLRTLRGDVNVRGVAQVLGERFLARAKSGVVELRARVGGAPAPRSEIERAFVSLSDRGVESLLVFSFSDGGLDMIARHLGNEGRRMRARSNFVLSVVEGADHTFTPIASQEALYGLVREFIATRFG
jgi:alpha-beta hydrolase superfamily lysophospholipase